MTMTPPCACKLLCLLLLGLAIVRPAAGTELYHKQSGWTETLAASRQALKAARLTEPNRSEEARRIGFRFKEDFAVEWDWLLQDGGAEFWSWLATAEEARLAEVTSKAIDQLGEAGAPL